MQAKKGIEDYAISCVKKNQEGKLKIMFIVSTWKSCDLCDRTPKGVEISLKDQEDLCSIRKKKTRELFLRMPISGLR